jgi:hypothetical protein
MKFESQSHVYRSNFFLECTGCCSPMNTMDSLLSPEDIRNLVQGPSDFEWRWFPHPALVWTVISVMISSRYEMRRTCQEIVPGFFVGPVQVSKDREMLASLGITHMCVYVRRSTRPHGLWSTRRAVSVSKKKTCRDMSGHGSRDRFNIWLWRWMTTRTRI